MSLQSTCFSALSCWCKFNTTPYLNIYKKKTNFTLINKVGYVI